MHKKTSNARKATSSAAGNGQGSSTPPQGATGPRTTAGKRRSSRNARKHGIFSREVVLDGEPRAEYDALLEGFLDYFRPVGAPEEVEVERLVTNLWRQRRHLVAEAAEIRRGTEFVEWNRDMSLLQDAEQIEQERNSDRMGLYNRLNPDETYPLPGLVFKIRNPQISSTCMTLLVLLRYVVQARGFDEQRDMGILEAIYGNRNRITVRNNLLDSYKTWFGISRLPEEERNRKGFASPEKCTQNFLLEMDAEISCMQAFRKLQISLEASRVRLEERRLNVPESQALDRLLRYEASLDRSFDRTLNRLQRMQKLRRAQ